MKRFSENKKRRIAKLFGEIDEGEAAAEYFELKVHGTLYIILEAYKRNVFKSKAEVISIVNNMLRKGF